MPRPANPDALTAAERKRLSRARRRMVTLDLPQETADALDAQARQHGDRSRLAVVQRLLKVR